MHKMRKSEAQLTGCSLPRFLLLGQYRNIILMLQKEFLPSDSLDKGRTPSKYFLRAADPLDYLDPLTATQVTFYLIIHSDQIAKLSKA
jgi:hypothetical protein